MRTLEKYEERCGRINFLEDLLVSIVAWLIVTFMVLSGIYVLYLDLVPLHRSYQARSWPQVEGVVISSKLWEGSSGNTYYLETEYEYLVKDVRHTSRMEAWSNLSLVRNILAVTFREGKQVEVYYDPENPEVSVIERGIPLRFVFSVPAMAYLTFLGLRILLGGISDLCQRIFSQKPREAVSPHVGV